MYTPSLFLRHFVLPCLLASGTPLLLFVVLQYTTNSRLTKGECYKLRMRILHDMTLTDMQDKKIRPTNRSIFTLPVT
jgi:hypothetical protein